jgi:DNA helicase II / ATP-dependent DNA helicase PcrA
MFDLDTFVTTARATLDKQLDTNQLQAVSAERSDPLLLVAGPGSGKTTVLTLRVLKLIFVDNLDPITILATTFTRKAAAELRSRILGWGDSLRQALRAQATPPQLNWLDRLDLNRTFIGTLDSVTEQVLRDFRSAGMQPPIVLDEFVSRALLFREGVLGSGAWQNTALKTYLGTLCQDDRVTTATMGTRMYEIRQRIIQDMVEQTSFLASQAPIAQDLLDAISAYEDRLQEKQALDFALLEQTLLDRLRSGALQRFTNPLRALLVDEYQDTNQLQEAIYFELSRSVLANGGSVTVVGDDDQSLYRFRGATVDLFRDFASRFQVATQAQVTTIYLNTNYRSTQAIVNYCMAYIYHDTDYGPARVAGKPDIVAGRSPGQDLPILTLFRSDPTILAADLAGLIRDVVLNGRQIQTANGPISLRIDPTEGAAGDIALLCSSPRDYSSGGNARLPLLLRQALDPTIKVFNPRGQEFSEIPPVARLCGLMLECIDPGAVIQSDATTVRRIPNDVQTVLAQWRQIANTYIQTNPNPPGRNRQSLAGFVRAWQQRNQQQGGNWPDMIEPLKLLYDLITWIPEMQSDPEGLVHLEAITRTMTQAATFGSFEGQIRFGAREENSIRALIVDIFAPLAAGDIEIDEDLLETTPRDRINVLSIHQSKGLEFPLVIVDVGSDFKRNHPKKLSKKVTGGSGGAASGGSWPDRSCFRSLPSGLHSLCLAGDYGSARQTFVQQPTDAARPQTLFGHRSGARQTTDTDNGPKPT